jgi:hypothetical protein
VFLDANVLFSAAYLVVSHLHGLWRSAEATLVTSEYAVEEARRKLPPQARSRLSSWLTHVEIVRTPPIDSIPLPSGLLLPAKDVPIFVAAQATGASHLLTGDKRHFGAYYGQTFGGVLILPPSDYLRCGR